MLAVIAKLPIKEGKMDEAIAGFKALMEKVAKEEGTMMYSLNRDPANPNVLVMVERYKDKAALEAHSSSDYFKEFFKTSGAFIGGRPEITRLEEIASI